MNWILDLDGVVWRGIEAVEGSPSAISKLTSLGHKVFFVTNNSLLTLSQYVKKMESFGIVADKEQIFTSGMAAASLLSPGTKVYLVGGGGLREAVLARDVELVDGKDAVDAVVLGWDPKIDFEKLTIAMRAIRSGAKYIATNTDPTYPNPDGLLPGTGTIAAAVATASGVDPIVAGKPNPPIVSLIKSHVSEEDVMVGDRLSTDGNFARSLGVHFGLVLSGVNEEVGDFDLSQSATIADDLSSMVSLFEKNGYLPNGDFRTSRP